MMRLLRVLFLRILAAAAIAPHFLKTLARWLHLLSLESSFDHIQRIGHKACDASSCASAQEVPEVAVLALPGAHHSLQVLVAADDDAGEGYVHGNCEWVGSVEAAQALLADDIPEALRHTEVFAQLQSLLHH